MIKAYFIPNPLKPTEFDYKTFPEGTTIREIVDGYKSGCGAAMVSIDGDYKLRESWNDKLESESIVSIEYTPMDPISGTVAGISAAVAIGTAIGVGVSVYKANRELDRLRNQSSDYEAAQPSPTYNRNYQGNHVRLGQAVPVIYGQFRTFPDFVAKPYSDFDANGDEWVHYLLGVGMGRYEHNWWDIKIGNHRFNDIGNITDIVARFFHPDTDITNQDYDTKIRVSDNAGGQNFEFMENAQDTDNWLGPFRSNEENSPITHIHIDTRYPNGLGSAYNSTAGIAYYRRNATFKVQSRELNADGTVKAGAQWGNEMTFTVNIPASKSANEGFGNTTALRFVNPLGTPKRYQVRIRLSGIQDSLANSSVRWANKALLSLGTQIELFQVRSANEQDAALQLPLTTISMEFKVNKKIAVDSERKVSVLARRVGMQRRVNGAWLTDPANQLRLSVAIFDILRNKQYGMGLEDNQIDVAGIETLDLVWNTALEGFCAVFDRQTDAWEALKTICAAGRATPIIQNGIVKVVRDQSRSEAVGVFTSDNIVRNSLSVSYATAADIIHDGIEAKYLSPDAEEITYVYGVDGTPTNPKRIEWVGSCLPHEAEPVLRYMAKRDKYRRKRITFQTEMDGLLLGYGDLIDVSHDLLNEGLTLTINTIAKSGNNLRIYADEDIPAKYANVKVILRQTDGSGTPVWNGTVVRNANGDYIQTNGIVVAGIVVANGINTITIGTQSYKVNTHDVNIDRGICLMGSSDTTLSHRGIVVGTKPIGTARVEVSAVNYDERVYQ